MQSHIALYIVWVLKYYVILLTILFVIFTWVNLLFWILLCINFLLEYCIFHCLDIFYQYTILYWVLFGLQIVYQYCFGYCIGSKKGVLSTSILNKELIHFQRVYVVHWLPVIWSTFCPRKIDHIREKTI